MLPASCPSRRSRYSRCRKYRKYSHSISPRGRRGGAAVGCCCPARRPPGQGRRAAPGGIDSGAWADR
eukprot:scaffold49344_cov37-Phaeocystis_antarctica.AAC.2